MILMFWVHFTLLFVGFVSAKIPVEDLGSIKSIVYDITWKKDSIISDMCSDDKGKKEWNLTSELYWRQQDLTIENRTMSTHQPKRTEVDKNCAKESFAVGYGIFFDAKRLCDVKNVFKMTHGNPILGGNMTLIIQPDDKNISKLEIEQNCTSLCAFLICRFDSRLIHLGIDVDLNTFICLYSTCPYVFQNIGFLVLTYKLNTISSMLSYGGFYRIFDPVFHTHAGFWKQENPLGRLYLRITIKSTVGLDTDKLDKMQYYLQQYSSFWLEEYWSWEDPVILESSKTFKEANWYGTADHSKNSTVYPKIEMNKYNLRNIESLCYFWHTLDLTTHDFKQYFLPVDSWESTGLLIKNAETLCNFIVNPDISILVYGKQNQSFIENMKNLTNHISYSFPTLIYLETEKLNDSSKNVIYVKSYKVIHSRFVPENIISYIPTFILLNNELSAQEDLSPILPKLDKLLQLTKDLKVNYSLDDPTFFIEFNITDQSKAILGANGQNESFKANLFCWDDLIKMKEVQEGLLNWAYTHDFKVTAFPVIDTQQNLGWTYDVVTTPALKRNGTYFTTTVKRNTPKYVGAGGGDLYHACIDKCVASRCEANFIGTYYSGVTLNLDEHSKFVNLSDTHVKNLLVLAFEEFKIVELTIREVTLLKTVFRVLNYDLKRELSQRVQRNFEDIVLYVSAYKGDDDLINSNLENISGFSPDGISFAKWENNHNETPPTHDFSFGVGIEVEDCASEINSGLKLLKLHPLFSVAKFIVCLIDGYLDSNYMVNEEKFQKYLDTHIFIYQYFKFYHKIDTNFRVSFKTACNTASDIAYNQNLKYFLTQFASDIYIHYFVGDVFINCSEYKIMNYSDLLNPTSYTYLEDATHTRHPVVPLFNYPPTNQTDHPSNLPLLISVPILSVFTFFAISCVYFYYRNKKPKVLSQEEIDAFLNGEEIEVTSESIRIPYVQFNTVKSLGFNKAFEIAKKDVLLGIQIGAGHFGEVFKAVYMKSLTVAVKLPNLDCSREAFKTMLSKVKILSYLGCHDHVLQFIGAYTNEIDVGLIYIVTEFCENGTLKEYFKVLRQKYYRSELGEVARESESLDNYGNNPDTSTEYTTQPVLCCILPTNEEMSNNEVTQLHASILVDLCRYAKEIASGMEFISSKKVVHSDLSARNILLTGNNTCKIADFGLSRKLYERTTYIKKGKEALPWRWMAIESLMTMEFTTKSDMWSYGVTLWEIFSLGETPYSGMVWNPEFTNLLEEGLRLPKPGMASDDMFEKMRLCWNPCAKDRPEFEGMQEYFESYNVDCTQNALSPY